MWREEVLNLRSTFCQVISTVRFYSCISPFTDIEMIFSLDAERLLTRVANKLVTGKKKIVLVIRRFEVGDGLDVPRTAEQLYDMFLTNKS